MFTSSLGVCHTSAKLHIQVAKLRLHEYNITRAEYHIKTAKAIDPSFCDIGY